MSITDGPNIIEARSEATSDGHRSYTVVYLTQTDNNNDGPLTVQTAAGMPGWGSTFAYGNDLDIGAFFTGRSTELVNASESYRNWRTTVNFSTRPREQCDESQVDDPLNQPVIWSGSFFQASRQADKDRNENALTTSASEPLAGITVDDSRPTIRATKNLATLNLSLWSDFRDALNATTFLGLSKRKVKVSNISWQQAYKGTCVVYYVVNYEFHVNEDTFDFDVFDRGFRKLDAGGKSTKILESDLDATDKPPLPINTPAFLDGAGGVLPTTGDPVIYGSNGINTKWEIYKERDFGLLGLPSSI